VLWPKVPTGYGQKGVESTGEPLHAVGWRVRRWMRPRLAPHGRRTRNWGPFTWFRFHFGKGCEISNAGGGDHGFVWHDW